MNPVDMSSAWETFVAYGGSGSGWAASKINMWLGIILGAVFLVVSLAIVRDKKKEDGDKVKSVALLAVCITMIAAVVMMFVNNQYGSVTGKLNDVAN